MKLILVLSITFLFTGCASFTGPSAEELNARAARNSEQEQRAALLAKQDKERRDLVLQPGTAKADVEKVFGPANQSEFKDGILSSHNSSNGDFYIFQYRDSKLIGWNTDTQARDHAEAEQAQNRTLAAQQAQQAIDAEKTKRRAIGAALQSFGNSMQNSQTVNCTTTSFGYSSRTICH